MSFCDKIVAPSMICGSEHCSCESRVLCGACSRCLIVPFLLAPPPPSFPSSFSSSSSSSSSSKFLLLLQFLLLFFFLLWRRLRRRWRLLCLLGIHSGPRPSPSGSCAVRRGARAAWALKRPPRIPSPRSAPRWRRSGAATSMPASDLLMQGHCSH